MKFLILSAVLMSGVVPGFAATAAAGEMAGAQVTLPYSEFRTLIDSLKKTEAPKPPPAVPFAVLASRFFLAPESMSMKGTVTFEVESFGEQSQLVPLIGDAVTIRKVVPEGARVIQKAGFYNLLMTGANRQVVTLEIDWPGREEEGEISYHCPLAPAVISEVEIGKLPEGFQIGVAEAAGTGNRFFLGSRESVTLHLRKPQDKPTGELVAMPSVVTAVNSEMRVVNDGTFFNATTWKIRHNTAVTWKVHLGEETQVVSCLVDGHPTAPVLAAGHTMEIRLPEKDSETEVALAYTGKTIPFAPVRGDFSVSLPFTDLLVERSDWKLTLPAAFAPVAVEGNAEFLPGEARNELRLRKELCRGEAPSIRVFYQKPETTKKP